MRAQPDGSGLAKLQNRFAGAVLQARLSVPVGIRRHPGAPSERRFGVYRNNVKASLAAALAARFPVVKRLVGDEFFTAMALVFIERNPPRSPVLAEYGASLANFLEAFDPAADLPYLPDIARLEWAHHVAFHAADAVPVDIGRLAELPQEQLGSLRLVMHPAMTVIASPWPVFSLWTTNTYDAIPRAPATGWMGEMVLVTRPQLEVCLHPLPPGADRLVSDLARGVVLGQAAEAALRTREGFDLAATLSVLFSTGAIASLTKGPSE